MGQFLVKGKDQAQIPPPRVDFVPPPKPPVPGRAADANDDGWLWWDHDDDARPGAVGEDGDSGIDGQAGTPGGSTPLGTTVLINHEIDGVYQVLISGGMGQPGGDAGRGGDGGRGQDGGQGADGDEHPPAAGGRGGRGGNGGRGGAGGAGGDIHEVDIVIGPGVAASQVAILYTRGFGGSGGHGGDPGAGGSGGTNGDGSPAMQGDSGINPGFGANGALGIVTPAVIVG